MEPAARKQKILSAIVESFIRSGEPVGSKSLLDETGLKVSSATVRNDMADLTEQGYLEQPHTSAGRVPTEQGYRFYVDNVMRVLPLNEQGSGYIRDVLSKNADSPESILQGAADILSSLTGTVALATTPSGEGGRVRHISFVPIGSHTAMAVVSASNGIIKTKLFRCEFVLTPEILRVFDKALNEAFAGVALHSVTTPSIQTAAAGFGELSLFMTAPLTAMKDACEQAAQVSVCHSGFERLMNLADQSPSGAHRLWMFLQNEHDLAAMLERLPQTPSVVIGSENRRTELQQCAVVSAHYAVGGSPAGVLAAVGPMRMDYARVMSILCGVADCAGGLIDELIEI